MTGEDMESQNSPEAQAAKGAEVRKKVEVRLAGWKEKMLAKNRVAKEYVVAWNKCIAAAKEGSIRRQLLEKITPVIETAAMARGAQVEMTKWNLKAIGLVCKVAGLVGMLGGPEIGLPIGAIGTAAGLASNVVGFEDKAIARSMGKAGEVLDKTGLARRVDTKIDKIFGWKGPEIKLAPKTV